jgi:hypothetical protein
MIMEAPMKSRVNSAGDRKERTAEVLYKNERGISSDSNKRSSLVHAKRTKSHHGTFGIRLADSKGNAYFARQDEFVTNK